MALLLYSLHYIFFILCQAELQSNYKNYKTSETKEKIPLIGNNKRYKKKTNRAQEEDREKLAEVASHIIFLLLERYRFADQLQKPTPPECGSVGSQTFFVLIF